MSDHDGLQQLWEAAGRRRERLSDSGNILQPEARLADFKEILSQRSVGAYSLGTRIRLIIKDPDTPNSRVKGCSPCPPSLSSPNHTCPPIASTHAAAARRHTKRNDVGIGVPSKKVTFPAGPESA